MDRIDAMKVFVAAIDEGSLAGAARKLGKSPAAVSRAIAFLEHQIGAELIHRTTRSLKLSEAGDRYIVACRRVLTDLEEADILAAGERSAPRGLLTLTSTVMTGEEILRPVVDAFLEEYPAVCTRLHLLDRWVNLIDEGIDLALRIGDLADSALIAIRIGEVRRVVVAAPRYLEANPAIREPGDLAQHRIIAYAGLGTESWAFPAAAGASVPRTVTFTPRLTVNTIRAATASAIDGFGVTRLLSYHIAEPLRAGKLKILLAQDEGPQQPVHLLAPQGRLQVPKVRAFVEFAVPRLKALFARLSIEADSAAIRS